MPLLFDPALAALPVALSGEFTLESEIGRGAMGVVYLARDLVLDRQVALKVLPPDTATSEARPLLGGPRGAPPGRHVLDRFFDPFSTTKPQGKGTGLGLSIAYGIVKEHGGTIRAESRKGLGSIFTVENPIVSSDEAVGDLPDAPRASAGEASTSGHLLVVDDEAMILDLLVEVLSSAGHRIDTAADGCEALRKIKAQGYDLVLSDVRMPEMNGMDLYREAIAARPEIKGRFVSVTGDLIDREVTEFVVGSDVRMIGKPLDIAALQGLVATSVEEIRASVGALRGSEGRGA